MRNRKIQLNIRLSEEEIAGLKRDCVRTGLSISAYIRMLMNGNRPKETPPIEYRHLMDLLYRTESEITNADHPNETAELRRLILALQETVTAPVKIDRR